MSKISYSTIGFQDRNVEAALDSIARFGFNQVEILGQKPHVAVPPTGQALVVFRRCLECLKLSASVHAPLGKNVLGAPDEELRPFVDAYPQEWLGLVIDTGHVAALGNDSTEEIHIAGDRLYGTHLHDTDPGTGEDNHWLPTHGGLDWDAIRHAFVEADL